MKCLFCLWYMDSFSIISIYFTKTYNIVASDKSQAVANRHRRLTRPSHLHLLSAVVWFRGFHLPCRQMSPCLLCLGWHISVWNFTYTVCISTGIRVNHKLQIVIYFAPHTLGFTIFLICFEEERSLDFVWTKLLLWKSGAFGFWKKLTQRRRDDDYRAF